MKKFQQSSFHTHKPQAANQQTTFMSSNKARNWAATDELAGIFSEVDEFTQFEAAPMQQGDQGNDNCIEDVWYMLSVFRHEYTCGMHSIMYK